MVNKLYLQVLETHNSFDPRIFGLKVACANSKILRLYDTALFNGIMCNKLDAKDFNA